MFISCLMATYNRGPGGEWMIAEAVESFLRQTHPASDRELLILNDTPGQTVRCQHRRVYVYNAARRYPTLACKYNELVRLARGDHFAVWDDDDVSLPHRLELSARRIATQPYWHTTRHIFAVVGQAWQYSESAVAHNAALFTRRLVNDAGGFRGDADWDQNFQFDAARVMRLNVYKPPADAVSDREVYYVYRWGVSPAHVSGMANGYRKRGLEPVEAGTVTVRPRWIEDYAEKAEVFANMKIGK